jgi:hypothetical protein
VELRMGSSFSLRSPSPLNSLSPPLAIDLCVSRFRRSPRRRLLFPFSSVNLFPQQISLDRSYSLSLLKWFHFISSFLCK